MCFREERRLVQSRGVEHRTLVLGVLLTPVRGLTEVATVDAKVELGLMIKDLLSKTLVEK